MPDKVSFWKGVSAGFLAGMAVAAALRYSPFEKCIVKLAAQPTTGSNPDVQPSPAYHHAATDYYPHANAHIPRPAPEWTRTKPPLQPAATMAETPLPAGMFSRKIEPEVAAQRLEPDTVAVEDIPRTPHTGGFVFRRLPQVQSAPLPQSAGPRLAPHRNPGSEVLHGATPASPSPATAGDPIANFLRNGPGAPGSQRFRPLKGQDDEAARVDHIDLTKPVEVYPRNFDIGSAG